MSRVRLAILASWRFNIGFREGRRSVEVRHAEERRGDCMEYIAVEGLGLNAASPRVSSYQVAVCSSVRTQVVRR